MANEGCGTSASEEVSGQAQAPRIVAIGASAGGLESFRQMLENLPSMGVGYVIAQHLDPSRESMLVRLLGSMTVMPVRELGSGNPVREGEIVVVPPGKHARMADDRFVLDDAQGGPRPSIDRLLCSLAEAHGERVISVICSGSGSDGALGVRAVRAHGGVSIVQDPGEAKFDSMCRQALATQCVDIIRPCAEIGPEIEKLLGSSPADTGAETVASDPHKGARARAGQGGDGEGLPRQLREITRIVAQKTGCDFTDYKPASLERRIRRRMVVVKAGSLDAYLEQLRGSDQEAIELSRDVMVSVTAFFRDAEAFEALEGELAETLKEPGKESLRIWVPGCATGEEAYSVAITADRAAQRSAWRGRIQVFGTDLDEAAIESARRGYYAESALDGVAADTRERYFTPCEGGYQVGEMIRERVIFARQDLVRDPPFVHLDLISCRNVLIYFQARLQERVLGMFGYALHPRGILFLGSSETVAAGEGLFGVASSKWRIYRRSKGAAGGARNPVFGALRIDRGTSRHAKSARGSRPRLQEDAREAFVAIEGPRALVLDSEQRVRHVLGDVSEFVCVREGDLTQEVSRLVHPELSASLQALAFRARRERGRRLSCPAITLGEGAARRRVILEAAAFHSEALEETAVLVLFRGADSQSSPGASDGENEVALALGADERREFEQEIDALREQLQGTVEEFETTSEELQSANEELQSSNEELQSTNEELETANEELQSTNEEMKTVNDELQMKSEQLADANADLQNVLRAAGFGVVIVDEHLRVIRHTSSASEIFHISPLDENELITSVPTRYAIPELRERITRVIESEETEEYAVGNDERRYLLRLSPYQQGDSMRRGAVIAIIDQTEQHRANRELTARRAQGDAMRDNAVFAIVAMDAHGEISSFNGAAERLFGYRAEELIGEPVEVLMSGEEARTHRQWVAKHQGGGTSRLVGSARVVTGRRKDGSAVRILIAVNQMVIDGERQYVAIMAPADSEGAADLGRGAQAADTPGAGEGASQ